MTKRSINKILVILAAIAVVGMRAAAPAPAADAPSLHGFVEADIGLKVNDDKLAAKNGCNMAEERAEFRLRYFPDELAILKQWNTEIFFKADVLMDEYTEQPKWWGPRELYIAFTPFSFADVKIGEQILTWGTGDYIFINDQFPKDYVSFIIGRDDDYLKLPSYAGRLTLSNKFASLDLVAIPAFTPNNVPKGKRISFFDPLFGRVVGTQSDRYFVEPPMKINNTEAAARLYGTVNSYEWALYYNHGFYKSPVGYKNQQAGELYYPELDVYGASIQGPLPVIGGIANFETGLLNSKEDDYAKNRLVQDSTMQYLVGYKRGFKNDFEAGLQCYIIQMMHYTAYKNSLLPGDLKDDKIYQQYTLRLTKLFANQTVNASLFAFYSPVDKDAYLRPSLSWKATDAWSIVIGGNIFLGNQDNADWGQFKGDSNIYSRLRYSY
ncbi:MAG: hypothetical protein A3K16_00945 [Omnitrophica bacterium RIFCSPLOWO2_01_FULL_45_24]|nr:MAG: hypothetical protein A3C51_03630 [Omnitrophica bacterium RIFCSPHIGHO2_02_FULL_46_20]OGW94887.1 MAG: hypothetical protein A3K16_00945 [Omnitrophica bacterium RIFCSPLOWO2_01_FULL_45_24]